MYPLMKELVDRALLDPFDFTNDEDKSKLLKNFFLLTNVLERKRHQHTYDYPVELCDCGAINKGYLNFARPTVHVCSSCLTKVTNKSEVSKTYREALCLVHTRHFPLDKDLISAILATRFK